LRMVEASSIYRRGMRVYWSQNLTFGIQNSKGLQLWDPNYSQESPPSSVFN
jgi:hypothetical protein